MKESLSDKGLTGFQLGITVFVAVVILFIAVFLFRRVNSDWLKTALEKSTRQIHLIQTIKGELLASAEAEKSSVMADTDETSKAFAEQSLQASQNVEKARIELKKLLPKNSKEMQIFNDFSSSWEKLRKIDAEVLSLAVQNTNLKALRLCFGPAAAALNQFEESLSQLMDSAATAPDAARITRLSARALMGAGNIYALQPQHIAETTDEKMDSIEASMKQYGKLVHDALEGLNGIAGESNKQLIDKANKSYQAFQAVNTEIIVLSRRNSNIRSFAVSLGHKRNTMAQCLDLLSALQIAIQEAAEVKATR